MVEKKNGVGFASTLFKLREISDEIGYFQLD